MKALVLILLFTSYLNFQSITQIYNASRNNISTQIETSFKDWDNYFKENYFDKGYDKFEMKGTGYYPYTRARYFYEMRAFEDGSMPDVWQEQAKLSKDSFKQSSTFLEPSWQSLGPNTMDTLTGRLMCYAFHPANSNVIYAGAGTGGLWKTENAGESWQVVTDNLPSLRVSCIGINPGNPDHMLIGTGYYMFPSFTLQPGIGLLESFDGGITWQNNNFSYLASNNVSTIRMKWDAGDPNNVYLAASNGLWISTDMGVNWTKTLNGIACDLLLNQAQPNIVYAAIESQGIFKSLDHGNNWTQLTSGLPGSGQIHRIGIALADSFPDYLLAGITNPVGYGLKGVYKSNDGGSSWQAIPNAPEYVCQPFALTCQGWFVNQVAMSPVDTNLIFVGGVQFWRSGDGGDNWTWHDYASNFESNAGLTYVDCHDIAFDPQDPETIFVFNDGGMQKSTNNGLWWERMSQDLVTAQCYLLAGSNQDTSKLIVGTHDHGLQSLHNSENNLMWRRWSNSDGTSVFYDPDDDNIVYGDILFGKHVKSYTGGQQGVTSSYWMNQGINDNISTVFLFSTMHHPDSSGVLYTSTDNFIYKTVNGNYWNNIASIPFVKKIEVSPVNSNIVYAASWNSNSWNFHQSIDAGNNWLQSPDSPGWRVTDVEADPIDEAVVYATRNSSAQGNPHVYRSDDYGISWSSISNGLPDVSTNAILIHPMNNAILFVATDLGVFFSIDKGEFWNEYNGNLPPYYVMDLQYHLLDNTLRISTLGRGIWKARAHPDFLVSLKPNSSEIPVQIEAYPNPFNEKITVKYIIEERSEVSMEVYNMAGQRIYNRMLGFQSNGNNISHWNGTNASGMSVEQGIYFMKIIIGNIAKTVMVQKN